MPSTDDADEVEGLLAKDYAAPELDPKFSTELISRLRSAASPSVERSRSFPLPLVVGLSTATVVVLVVGLVWKVKLSEPMTQNEVAQQKSHETNQDASEIDGDVEIGPEMEGRVESFSIVQDQRLLSEEQFAENDRLPDTKGDEFMRESEELLESLTQDLATNPQSDVAPKTANDSITPKSDSPSSLTMSQLSVSKKPVPKTSRNLSSLGRRSLAQCVADAKAIVVGTAVSSAPAPPKRPGDARENLMTFNVKEVLKGELKEKTIATRTPTNPAEFIGHTWVVMLSPEYVAGNHKFAGIYGIKLKSEIINHVGDTGEDESEE